MKEYDKYLKLLKEKYPTKQSVYRELINLNAIMNLPKGTEHFMSDLHGEYDAFYHIINNCSGVIREKVAMLYGDELTVYEQQELCTLIYYPREKLSILMDENKVNDEWYRNVLDQLIQIAKLLSSKYTRSKVRKAMPVDFAYIIDELIHAQKDEDDNRSVYHRQIMETILSLHNGDEFLVALTDLIKRLAVDHLHILGDIYDRGSHADKILDLLMEHHSVDIQWGNHDVVWMGAATGQKACIATVIRNSIRYRNMDILEDGYGINLMPLATFAMEAYKDDPCTAFEMKGDANNYSILEEELGRKMHKAIAIIQFKLEGQLIRRHKEFHMEKRCLLHRIDPKKGMITLPDGKEYPLTDTYFPTIDWKKPYELTTEEKDVMERLDSAFRNCEKLQNHVRLLLDKGGLYKTYNGNLLFHGSIPLNEDGSLKEVQIYGKTYKGKELYDVLETYVRRAFFSVNEDEKRKGRDIMWYIWAAPNSPLFGKDKMTTFERYFIKDKETHKETKNAYYHLLENENVVDDLLREFELDPEKGHIINGHVPVHQSEGESPVKCNGKVLVIDGGFSRPYQKVTGIAGYTLVYNSYGLILSAHEPFTSAEEAVAQEQDIVSNRVAVHYNNKRTLVGDTDTGTALKERISELIQLLEAYRKGIIKEKK